MYGIRWVLDFSGGSLCKLFAIMTPTKNLIFLRRQLKFKEMELVEMQFDPQFYQVWLSLKQTYMTVTTKFPATVTSFITLLLSS